MKIGDIVSASWGDGLELVGRYTSLEQGYIIITTKDGNKIVCDPNHVIFKVLEIT